MDWIWPLESVQECFLLLHGLNGSLAARKDFVSVQVMHVCVAIGQLVVDIQKWAR